VRQSEHVEWEEKKLSGALEIPGQEGLALETGAGGCLYSGAGEAALPSGQWERCLHAVTRGRP